MQQKDTKTWYKTLFGLRGLHHMCHMPHNETIADF